MKISAKCPNCQSEQFMIPDENDSDQNIYCASCNELIGDKAEVQAEFRAQSEKLAEKEIGDMMERSFGKSGHFKFQRK